jgi:hypothetical protein
MKNYMNRLVLLFIMTISLMGCGSDKQEEIGDPAFRTTYIVVNNTNYNLSVDPVLHRDDIFNDTYLGEIDSGADVTIYDFIDMASSAMPPSGTFQSLKFTTDLGSGMEVVYSTIDNENWVVEDSGEVGHSNYVLYLVDENLSL